MKTVSQLAILFLATFNLSAATLYVALESPNPTLPYATWATAATNIQDAVDATRAGDTVLVTNGVYAVGSREVSVLNTNVEPPVVESKGSSRVVATNAIRLESVNGPLVTTIEGSGDRAWMSGTRCVHLGANAVLSGFTLTNGRAIHGGGVYSDTSGIVTNCTLTGNDSMRGGGAYGGTLYNCTLTGNSVVGSMYATGGGAYGSTLYNCTITGNFRGPMWGGGGATASTLYNCLVSGNTGMGAQGSTLYNCTVAGNKGGGVIALGREEGRPNFSSVYNSIIYYNSGENCTEGSIVNYSCTSPLPTDGVGNIAEPPLFMDMAEGDFRLREESPCIDAGMNLMGVTPMLPSDQTVGAPYAHDTTDILGNTRFIDGNFDGRAAWDMGAYEFNSFRPPQFTCAPQRMPYGWRLSLTGAPNKWVHVQRSSDLKNWEEIWVGFMGSAGVKQVDDVDLSQNAMFYRAVVE